MGWAWDTHTTERGTVGHPVECPKVPWDRGMGSGIHTQLREGQLDIPWNVPRSHGAVGWDGLCDTHISERRTVEHPVECPMVPWDHGLG